MSVVVEYKCPNCAASLTFDSDLQEMHCEYCGTDFDIAAVKEYNETLEAPAADDYDWESYEEKEKTDAGSEENNIYSFTCPSCGGRIFGDSVTAATFCPYCGNPAILSERLSEMFRPDLVIPFRLDQSAAKAALLQEYKKRPLLPNLFKETNKIEKITGLYVPFWLYDCGVEASVQYKATRISSWSDSRYRYTKTSYFSAVRNGCFSMENLPFDGSVKMDDRFMEAIEPFDFSSAVPFDSSYLSGYLADKYDVPAQEGIPRINARIKTTAENLFSQTVTGYQTVRTENSSVQVAHGKIRYALLPVWLLNTDYQGKKYTFVMNGQTGKLVGEYPVSRAKYWGFFSGIFAAAAALAGLVLNFFF